jgi:hypothetical protein
MPDVFKKLKISDKGSPFLFLVGEGRRFSLVGDPNGILCINLSV